MAGPVILSPKKLNGDSATTIPRTIRVGVKIDVREKKREREKEMGIQQRQHRRL
jgi:hypothetical protein